MALHVVLGKGAVGQAVARHLVKRGDDVRVLSRSAASGLRALPEAVEHRAVDAADADSLAEATAGAVALYNCANPAYTRWARDWPPMADALLRAAERTGAVLVTTSNVYPYGEVDGPLHEDLPLAATGTKGRVRAQMWRDALAAHEAGRVRVTEARASDFVGPGVTDQGFLGERAVPRLLRGKGVQVLGDPDAPHSYTSVLDVGATLVTLADDERAWGRAWHVPTAPAVSPREAVQGLCRAAGVDPVPVTRVPPLALRAMGLVVPAIRELRETAWQRERPFVLDARLTEQTFGLAPTPWETTLEQTVAWWRERLGTPAPGSPADA